MDGFHSKKRPPQSPREPRDASKARRVGDVGNGSNSRASSVDRREQSRATDSDHRAVEAVNTPSQVTYVEAIREVLGRRALRKDDIIKEVLERRMEFFPNKPPETVRAGLHTTFSNHSKSKDPKIREWAQEWVDGSRTTTVWACSEVNLGAGADTPAVERPPTTAPVDGMTTGAQTPEQTTLRLGRPQGASASAHGNNNGTASSTPQASGSRKHAAPTSWRAGSAPEYESHQDRALHRSHGSMNSVGDSIEVASGTQPNAVSSEAELNQTESSNRANRQQATPPTNGENHGPDPQLLNWGQEVIQIRLLSSRLEEMKARTSVLSGQADSLQTEREQLLARVAKLEEGIREANQQKMISTKAGEEMEAEIKKRTMELLGVKDIGSPNQDQVRPRHPVS